jgi:ABC-type multidrug transport system fused ATPase/permease subunit
MRRPSSPFKTFESRVRIELLESPGLIALLTLGVVGYAVGHASLAVSAGALGSAIAHPRPALLREPAMGAWDGSPKTLCYVGLAAALVKTTSALALAYAETRLGSRVANRFRATLVSRLLAEGSALPAPRLLAVLAVRLREIESAVAEGVLKGWRATIQLLPLAACCAAISPRLFAVALVLVLPFALAVAAFRRRARGASETAQQLVEALEASVDELVRNTDLFRTYGAGARVLAAIERSGDAAGRSAARVDVGRAALSGANEILAVFAVMGAAALASHMGRGDLNGALLPFSAVFFMAYRPLRDLGDAKSRVARGVVAQEAVERAAEGCIVSVSTGGRPSWRGASPPLIELSGFGAEQFGTSVTVNLEPGQIIGLVGRTGSGKTTLLRALLGLTPSCGGLAASGVDLSRAGVGPEHRPFAWVPQDAPLVTGTLAENVALLGGDEGSAADALRAVGAERLSAIADTDVVGPAGRPLSGGERRQVALARAFATDLPVLLLDEPTEGLDAEATAAVLAAMTSLRGRRTVLIATHRPEVVAITDKVVRLEARPATRELAAE